MLAVVPANSQVCLAAGMWCDAVPVLLHTEWSKTRQGLTAITSQSTNAAVAAWLQVIKALLRQPTAPPGMRRQNTATPNMCQSMACGDSHAHTRPQPKPARLVRTCSLLLMGSQAIQTRELLSSPTTGPRLRHAPAAGAPAVAISAVSAKRTWQAAQRFLTLTQLRGALGSPTGEVAVSSGLPGVTAEHLTHNQVLTGRALIYYVPLACPTEQPGCPNVPPTGRYH